MTNINNLYIIISILIIIIILLIILFKIYNKITIKKNNVLNAKSSIDIMLKKRYDLIPNLVEIIKDYTKTEKETLTEITELRKKALSSKIDEEQYALNNHLNKDLKKLFVLAENYPNLKSNINYVQLQTILSEVEEQISAARRTYNAHATDFNTYISIIPINLFAMILGFKKYNLFQYKETKDDYNKWIKNNE